MSEKRFDVGQRVVAEDTEREGVVQELDPAANAWWYAVEFGDVVLHYPHSLLRAIPADPAPTATDESWLAEIRTRVVNTPEDDLFVKANYNEYYMVRGVHNGAVFADVPITGTFRSEIQKGYADFIAAAPADIRRLLDALDDARRERDAAVGALREAYDWLDANGNVIPISGIDVWRGLRRFIDAKESDHADE